MLKKLMPILFLILLVLPIVYSGSITLDVGSSFNTSSSNSGVTFNSISATADQITGNAYQIVFYNISYTNNNFIVSIKDAANLSHINDAVDISQFPYISSDSSTTKLISSYLNNTVNATVTFYVDNCELDSITYTSHSGAFTQSWIGSDATSACSVATNRVTLSLIGVEPAVASNKLSIDYRTTNEDICINSSQALSEFSSWFVIIATIVAAAVVISYLYFTRDGLDAVEIARYALIIVVAIIIITIGLNVLAGMAVC